MMEDKPKPTRPQDYPFFQEAKYTTFQNASFLRKNQTTAEALLWEELRGRKLGGLKFRRQHSLQQFVADFYCHELKLVIELDGSIHDLKDITQYDEYRQKIIEQFGLKVLRFTNEEVLKHIQNVLNTILAEKI